MLQLRFSLLPFICTFWTFALLSWGYDFLILSKALLKTSVSHKLSKTTNLFERLIWYFSLISARLYSWYRISVCQTTVSALPTVSLSLISLSQSYDLKHRASSIRVHECLLLSMKMWWIRVWVVPLGESHGSLWTFWCGTLCSSKLDFLV